MQVDAVVGVEAREDDGGGGRRKPILDRKTKKETPIKQRPTRKRKPDQETEKKKTLGQPSNRSADEP